MLIGPTTPQSEWEEALGRVLVDVNRWVVQQVAPIPVKSFHVLDDADRLHVEPFYIVMGFAPSRYGVALVARASQRSVVNVAQQGGMCAVMVSAKALDGTALRPPGAHGLL